MASSTATPYEELLEQIRSTHAPDKDRILRTRRLANAIARAAQNPSDAAPLVREFNNAYLNLQLATLSDDRRFGGRYRDECIGLARRLGVAAGMHAGNGRMHGEEGGQA